MVIEKYLNVILIICTTRKWHIIAQKYNHVGVRVHSNFEHRKSKNKTDESALSAIISKKSETTLDLVSKMTSVTNRIDLESVKEMFGRLRTGRKIKLSEDLTNSVDSIISNNMTAKMEEYTDELSEMRWGLLYTMNFYYLGTTLCIGGWFQNPVRIRSLSDVKTSTKILLLKYIVKRKFFRELIRLKNFFSVN